MTDQVIPTPGDAASAAGAGLTYPFTELPEPGQDVEVAPGVRWTRMPLPFALKAINTYALDDGPAGWAVVDTGLRGNESAVAWRELFAKSTDGRGISRVFITHMHGDHIGMAGWLTRKFDCRLWMTRLEYLTCRVLQSDTGREAPEEAATFYHRAGWSSAAIETYRVRFGDFGRYIHALPQAYRRIRDGEEIRIGQHVWRVIVGTGHSPEHACFYCPDLKLFISGDQVLPRISSNVSVQPIEPDANPMGDWLATIDKLLREVPDDVLVLPSHNEPFRGLHARLRYLAASQQRSFARLLERLHEPRRVVDVFGSLFAKPVSEAEHGLLSMATGEATACLNYLVARGEVMSSLDDRGVAWYQAASAAV